MAAAEDSTRFGDLLECIVCITRYSLPERTPKLLPCGHTFCSSCLERLVNSSRIVCPKCKCHHRVDTDLGVDRLSTNHDLCGMLDYSCEACQRFCDTAKCSHCKLSLCQSCRNSHRGDLQGNIEESVVKIQDICSAVRQEWSGINAQMSDALEQCDAFCCTAERSLISGGASLRCLDTLQEDGSAELQKLVTIRKAVQSISYNLNNPDFHHGVEQVRGPDDNVVRGTVLDREPSLVFGDRPGQGQLNAPQGLAINRQNGHIYVADYGGNTICHYDPSGQFIDLIGADLHSPRDVAVVRSGELVVTDQHRVSVYSPGGALLHRFGQRGSARGQFQYPWGVAVNSKGFIHVCDSNNSRVQVCTQSGECVGVFGDTGNAECTLQDPTGIAIDDNDDIYVSDYGAEVVKIYSATGKYKCSIRSQEHSMKPSFVAVDYRGLIYVSDEINSCVHAFEIRPSASQHHGDNNVNSQKVVQVVTGFGKFQLPRGVAVTREGSLAVVDRDLRRVQLFCKR